jgi:hypothetical protein
MKKHILAAGAAVLAIGFSVSLASAAAVPCPVPYQHPAKAKQIKASLVQAFVSCGNSGGNTINATTETGSTPSCYPAETYNENAGSPVNGWIWGPGSSADITFKAAKNKVVHPLNTDPNAVDLSITIKMKDILDGNGPADNSNGRVATVARATFADRLANQLMTVIDFPTGFGITAIGGKVSKKTSATVILNALNNPALPACTQIEVVSVLVRDPNQNNFANIGTFLP